MATEGKHAKPKKSSEGPTQVLPVLESRSMLTVGSAYVELEQCLEILSPTLFCVFLLHLLVHLLLPELPCNLSHMQQDATVMFAIQSFTHSLCS